MARSRLQQRLGEVIKAVFNGSERAAARAAGVSQPTLHRLAAGKVTEPKLATVERLAAAYGLPLGWLTGESDDLPRDFPGGERVPLWWVLIRAYHEAARAEDMRWIESVGEGKSPEARRIIEQVRESGRVDRRGVLFATLVQPYLGAGKAIPKEHLPSYRSMKESETQVLRLAVKVLRWLGE